MRSIRLYPVLCFLLITGCAAPKQPSVADISREWLEIKTSLFAASGMADSGGGSFAVSLERFERTAGAFFASPVGRMYRVHGLDAAGTLGKIAGAADRLKAPVYAGKEAALPLVIADIDGALAELQRFDADISNNIQISYFSLFFFFAMLIVLTILVLYLICVRLENVRRYERQSRAFSRETIMAQEEERSRIARELHDSVAQDLWRLSFQTDRINRTAGAQERRLLCAEMAKGHQDLMERIRRICYALIPPNLLSQGLPLALRRLCHDFERRTGIECRLSAEEDLHSLHLNAEKQLQCFRLVQEALVNIEKHAQAREAVVVARNSVGENGEPVLLICVSDDGRGFAASSGVRQLAAEGHFGIRNMHERAAIINGKLTIDSEPGEGTTVTLEAPL